MFQHHVYIESRQDQQGQWYSEAFQVNNLTNGKLFLFRTDAKYINKDHANDAARDGAREKLGRGMIVFENYK